MSWRFWTDKHKAEKVRQSRGELALAITKLDRDRIALERKISESPIRGTLNDMLRTLDEGSRG